MRRVKSLIDRVQLATARDRQGLTPLHKAVLHGQTNTVRYLLARYPNIVNASDHVNTSYFTFCRAIRTVFSWAGHRSITPPPIPTATTSLSFFRKLEAMLLSTIRWVLITDVRRCFSRSISAKASLIVYLTFEQTCFLSNLLRLVLPVLSGSKLGDLRGFQHGHTPFYYRTHPRGMNLRTMKDNAVMNQLMTGELSRPLLQGNNA